MLSNVGKDKTGQLGLDFLPVTGEHRKSINNFLSPSHLGHKIIVTNLKCYWQKNSWTDFSLQKESFEDAISESWGQQRKIQSDSTAQNKYMNFIQKWDRKEKGMSGKGG